MSHVTEKVVHTAALVVILSISIMTLGACFPQSVEETHHAPETQTQNKTAFEKGRHLLTAVFPAGRQETSCSFSP